MACLVESVERHSCLYAGCVILGLTVVETQAGSLFAYVPGEHVYTYAQTAPLLCESSMRAV